MFPDLSVRTTLLVLLATLILRPSAAQPDDWVVPDQFLTIQAAIDFAEDGDAIYVRPGTYVECPLVALKALSIRSTEGPEVTIVDGSAPTRPDTLSVFCAIGTDSFLLDGFTVRNGAWGSTLGQGSPASAGGGIYLFGVGGATIRNCVVEQNRCEHGGGIAAYIAGGVTIEDCTIQDNEAESAGGGMGLFDASPQIRDCAVRRNKAPWGSGVYGTAFNGSLERVLIAENSTAPLANGLGGGVFFRDSVGPRIEGCTIARNRNGWGSGILLWESTASVSRSIVAFNEGGWVGIYCRNSNPVVDCCDIFGNEGGDDLCGAGTSRNFSLDPLLCDDYSIADNSPCAPEWSPSDCGLVGALGVGCVNPVEKCSWGTVKALHRR